MHTASTLPVLWCHGVVDDVIPFSYGEDALAFLRDSVAIPSLNLAFRVYDDLGHTTQDNELSDVASWIQGILG